MFKIRSSLFLQILSLILVLGTELRATDFLSIADGTPVYPANVNGFFKIVANHKAIIGANEAHRRGITGKNVRVAVIDSQYDFGSDTGAKLLPECLSRAPAVGTYEYFLRQNQAIGVNHSNHVASTIAGRNGIAPDVQLDVIDVYNDSSTRHLIDRSKTYYSDEVAAAAIHQAIKDKVHFINISQKFGLYKTDYSDCLKNAYYAARDAGIGIIQSGLNDSEILGSTPYTQNLSKLLVDMRGFMRLVVSTGYTQTGDEVVSSFSNQAGIAARYVISAPGQDILAFGAVNFPMLMSGTSMAAPCFTGTAALFKSANLNMPADQIFDVLSQTARKHNLKTRAALDSQVFGQGVVSVNAALDKLDAEARAAAAQARAAQEAEARAAAAQARAAQEAEAQAAAAQAAAAQAAAAQVAAAQAAATQAKAAQAKAAQAKAAQAKAAQAKAAQAKAAQAKAAKAKAAKAKAAKAKAAKELQDARRFLANHGVGKVTQAEVNKIKAAKGSPAKNAALQKIKNARQAVAKRQAIINIKWR